ncbi:MAG: tannase/feruloyl esterase family alpha/beta hydrolase, partial [Acidobacteriota bacterium]|nr:tannase/feruloyl esterase family alpha/beta hydrolase [Acidobacteriota bacterium]
MKVSIPGLGLCFTGLLFAQSPCENLANLKLANTRVTLAQVVEAGAFAPPANPQGRGPGRGAALYKSLPAFCRVAVTLTPTSDSDIKSEVWLPASGWNGKFEVVGNGGWAGTIGYNAIAQALSEGYAAAGTDTGHTGGSASFAYNHPEKLLDFGWRAVHETTVAGK